MILTLYSIAYACPKDERNDDCPLLAIDHLSFKEKIDWISELDKESQEFTLMHHFFCTKKR